MIPKKKSPRAFKLLSSSRRDTFSGTVLHFVPLLWAERISILSKGTHDDLALVTMFWFFECRVMFARVSPPRGQGKIFWTIVVLHSVYVMHKFFTEKNSSKLLFHNKAVLKHVPMP